jgi:hypothetical protein
VRALVISISKQQSECGYALKVRGETRAKERALRSNDSASPRKRILFYLPTAATLSVGSVALTAADAASDQLAEATQHWVVDHEALLDARLGYLKAVIRLTPDQNEVWEAFEKAVRRGAKAHRMRRALDVGKPRAQIPTERMDATAGRMARGATSSKRSLKPLNRCIAVSTIRRSASWSC